MNYHEASEGKKGFAKFLLYISWFLRNDNGDPSLMRVISIFNSVVGGIMGLKLLKYADVTQIWNDKLLWLVGMFVVAGVLGKGIQKLAEKAMDKKL